MKWKKFDYAICGHRLNNYMAKDINYIYVCALRSHHVNVMQYVDRFSYFHQGNVKTEHAYYMVSKT